MPPSSSRRSARAASDDASAAPSAGSAALRRRLRIARWCRTWSRLEVFEARRRTTRSRTRRVIGSTRQRVSSGAAIGRGARQAFAGEALGDLGVGVPGIERLRPAGLVERFLGLSQRQQGEGAVAVGAGQVDAGVGLGGGRGIAQAEGGVAERHAGEQQGGAVEAAGRRAGIPVGVEGEQVLVRLGEEVAQPALPFAVGDGRSGGPGVEGTRFDAGRARRRRTSPGSRRAPPARRTPDAARRTPARPRRDRPAPSARDRRTRRAGSRSG